ncbi:MAG: hypothetical protein WA989_10590 [Henriciella sp.]|uniref:hypothetical protein n=1 Tax=Henriciella sp. TaxID=1968823 RepID=UPI003C753476
MKRHIAISFAALLAATTSPAFADEDEARDLRTSEMPHINVEKAHDAAFSTDTFTFDLAPEGENGSRLEYKVSMDAGDVLIYSIEATGTVISEFHGQSDDSKAVFFYREQDDVGSTHGQFISPMTGGQGWYFANTSDEPSTVTLDVAGYYTLEPGLIEIPD